MKIRADLGDSATRLHVVVNNVDITNDITSYKKSGEYMTDGVFCLGNAPSISINLTLINKNGKYNSYLDKEFYIYEQTSTGIMNIGYFYVFDKPEKYTEVMELTLNDGMRGLGIPYNSQLSYPCQLLSQLTEIAQLTGYSIAPLPFGFQESAQIGFYDNSYTIRQHLAWIAEMNACNVWINRNRQIEFKPLTKYQIDREVPMALLGDLEDEQVDYQISRVLYDDGVNVYSAGDETGFTLNLNNENLYILNQEVVDYIYSKVGGFYVRSLSNIKMKGDPSIDLGDVISLQDEAGFEDYRFIVLELEETQNLNAIMQNLSGKIESKETQRTTDVINNKVKIKKIQTVVNQQEARLDIIAQEVNGIDDKIQGQLTVAKGEILGEVSQTYLTKDEFNTGKEDIANDVIGRIDLDSKLQITSNSILQEVSGKYETIDDHNREIKETNAKFELYVDKKNMISYINASADVITLNSNRLEVNSDKFKLAADGTLTATNGNFSGDITGSTITFGDLASKYVVMKAHKEKTYDEWGGVTGEITTGADIEGNGGIYISQKDDLIALRSYDALGDTVINQLEMDVNGGLPKVSLVNSTKYGDKINFLNMERRNDTTSKLQLQNFDGTDTRPRNALNMTATSTTDPNYASNDIFLYNRTAGGDDGNELWLCCRPKWNVAYLTNTTFGEAYRTANKLELMSNADIQNFKLSNYQFNTLQNANEVAGYASMSGRYIYMSNYNDQGKEGNTLLFRNDDKANQIDLMNYLLTGKTGTAYDDINSYVNRIHMHYKDLSGSSLISIANKNNMNKEKNKMDFSASADVSQIRIQNTWHNSDYLANTLTMSSEYGVTMNNYGPTFLVNSIMMRHDQGLWLVNRNKTTGKDANRLYFVDSTSEISQHHETALENYDVNQALSNRVCLSELKGLLIQNYLTSGNKQSEIKMDKAGNFNIYAQNSIDIKSDNYAIILRADEDNSHSGISEAGRVMIQAPKGLWVNGRKIA